MIMLNYNLVRRHWSLIPIAVIVLSLSMIFANHALGSFDDHYIDVRPVNNNWDITFDRVNRLRDLGIFEGTDCDENKFCPNDPVDRKTFAVWVIRALDGNDAPDFVGPDDISIDLSSILSSPWQSSLLSPEVIAQLTPRFEDVSKTYPENKFIERLAELGITSGCSSKPARYCPDRAVTRAHLAIFVSRALDLPESEPIGFWDVNDSNSYFASVNSLVGSGIDAGCSEIRFVPFNYCPSQLVSRAEMAELLSEVVDYIEASQVIKINEGSDPDNSINLSVSYDEDDDKHITKVTWNNPDNGLGEASHYVLQWRPSWEDFNYRRYQVVEFDNKGKYAVEFLPPIDGNKIYSIRIITAYDNDDEDHLVTDEVKVPSRAHYLRDLIKSHVIDAYGDSQPWLVDTWRHLNGPELVLFDGSRNQVNLSSIDGYPLPKPATTHPASSDQTIAGSLSLSQSKVDRFEYFMEVQWWPYCSS